jgi:hypothetical protein
MADSGDGGAAAAEAGDGAPAGDSGAAGNKVTEHTAPDGVPSKFFDVTNGNIDHASWGKSTKELEGKLRTSKADMKKSISEELAVERVANRPENASDYVLQVPKDFDVPEGHEWTFNEKDPMIEWWRGHVHEAGGDQDMFDKGINAYMSSVYSNIPDFDSEMGALGENGSTRIDAVNKWATANLTEDTRTTLEEFATTAKAIEALEELMVKSGEPAFSPSDMDGGGVDQDSMLELQKMQADPRYWDINKRDPVFVRKVDAGFERLFGS